MRACLWGFDFMENIGPEGHVSRSVCIIKWGTHWSGDQRLYYRNSKPVTRLREFKKSKHMIRNKMHGIANEYAYVYKYILYLYIHMFVRKFNYIYI